MKSKFLGLMATIFVSGNVMAASVEQWQGTGAVYTPEGKELSAYAISVVNTELADHTIQSEAKITLPDGSQRQVSQKITPYGNSWSVESNLGTGGGACYGKDVCANYIAGKNGVGFATTIVGDSEKTRRNITIKLQNGESVEVSRENLTRLP